MSKRTRTHFDIVSDEIRALHKTLPGGISAEGLFDWASKHPDAAVYQDFIWDKTKAWRELNLLKARQLIARVVFIVETPAGPQEARDFVVMSEETEEGSTQHYAEQAEVLPDPERRAQLIVRVLKAAYGELRHYPELTELDGIRKQIQKLIEKYSTA